MLKDKKNNSNKQIILISYYNLIYQNGENNFLKSCKFSGVDGLIIVDLRMIVFFSDIGLEEVKKLLPLVIFGFLVNLITGVLFLFGDPSRYSINIGFQIKMILVLLAGCNAAIYHLKVEPLFSNLNLTDRLPLMIKITGFTSLTLWTGVLLLGRLIPYVGTG